MSQSLARLWTHLIFSTKNRFPFLVDKNLRAGMHAYLAKMLREQDCETLIANGAEDHVHALFALSRRRGCVEGCGIARASQPLQGCEKSIAGD
jgi:REP-associated tyrosine transposase